MPHWKAKAALQRAFSSVPGGHRLNYLFQRRVTHGLPIDDQKLRTAVNLADEHVRALGASSSIPIGAGRFFEFGAGWDLHVAQSLYCLGVNDQTIVDLRPLLRAELVFDIARRLQATENASFARTAPPYDGSLEGYLASVGIEYRAPCDAGATGLPARSIDFVTSTSTLEHIPAQDIRRILHECHRIISDDGALSFYVDYKDHYAYFDASVSPYNFLRFDDREWKRFNASLHFQNRLRHSDYLKLFAEAGFEIAAEDFAPSTEADEALIERLPPAPQFADYSMEDLAIRDARVVLKKAP